MQTIKILAKGQIVIPASIRKKYQIHPGAEIQIFEYGNLIYLLPTSKDPIEQARGCLPAAPSLSDDLLQERKKDLVP